jgi:hypothetical protein
MIYVGQFPDHDRIPSIRASVLSQLVPRRAEESFHPQPDSRSIAVSARAAVDAMMNLWFGNDPPVARFAVDLRETNLFLNHAAKAQGLDFDLALLFGRWRQLPYWIESIWVPGHEAIRPYLSDRPEHGPFFVGSAKVLTEELDEVAAASPSLRDAAANAADRGEGMAEALGDVGAQRLRNVWRSYRDASALAVKAGLPLWTAL